LRGQGGKVFESAIASIIDLAFGPAPPGEDGANVQARTVTTAHTDLPSYSRSRRWTGEKYPGGLGVLDVLTTDYWTLRTLSAQAWKRSMYARGIIRRLVTNIINTGLHLEATPEEAILGVPDGSLEEWSELVEKRFELWANDPQLCDRLRANSFGEIQAIAKTEALVVGDVLCMLDIDQVTGLPLLRLENGANVQTPMERAIDRPGVNRVRDGVELDAAGRHVAYWVRQEDGKSKRIPAWGPKSKRRIAWLLYGTEKRAHETRGEPILSLVLQSLTEIDRYRDATARKAVIASMVALAVERDQPGTPSRSLTGMGGAPSLRKGLDTTTDTHGNEISYNSLEMIPGIIIEGLKPGEKIKALGSQGTDEKFGEFEEALIRAIAWCYEIPPEILCLSFSHNYSASQAANNEFALFLKRVRDGFSKQFCHPVYIEWLIAEVTAGKIEAAQLLESRRIPSAYDVFSAWFVADWAGQVKPAADMLKTVRAHIFLVDNLLMTRSRAMRELTGMKLSRAAKQARKDNELFAWAKEPLKTMEPEPKQGLTGLGRDDDDGDDEDEEASDMQTSRAFAVLAGRKSA
jgi:lambda family phage portal protein